MFEELKKSQEWAKLMNAYYSLATVNWQFLCYVVLPIWTSHV